MRRGRRTGLAVAGVLALLAGCGGGTVDPQPEQPAPRTSWTLRHRVVESKNLRIIASGIGQDDEWTGVSLRRDGAESCYVSVSAPGQGGPDNKVGDKVATTFRGRPAIREGAGAEGPYLMWQLQDGSWLEVSCNDDASTDTVASAVRVARSSVALPVAVRSLPQGYQVAQLMQDRERGTTDIYVGRAQPQFGGRPDSDLQISLVAQDEQSELSGRAVSVAGLPAVLSEEPSHPRVCVSVQARHVCIGITASDTGPYPDRSADVPTLLSIADQLHYAPDLADRSTWFAAETVFG